MKTRKKIKKAASKKNAAKKVTAKKAVSEKATAKKVPVKKASFPKTAPSAKIIGMFLKEMEQEAKTTRKLLERVPDDKHNWKPHEKSMTMARLATHIAELPTWVSMAVHTDELNFESGNYVPKTIKNNAELLELLEKSLEEARATLEKATDEILSKTWVMRSGDKIFSKSSKAEVIRMAYCQIVHHRAQLGVYLRLLNIPLPGSYGPSADDQSF